MLAAGLFLVLSAAPAQIVWDTADLSLGTPDRRALLEPLLDTLLREGRTVVPFPGRAGERTLHISGPDSEGALTLRVDDAPGAEVRYAYVPDEHELSRLRALLGPPRARKADRPAVAVGVAAIDEGLERRLARGLPYFLLEAGVPVTGHRQAVDPKVCVALSEAELRLARAEPGEACGRVRGRLDAPGRLTPAELEATLEQAVLRLSRDALASLARARTAEEPRGPDDDGTLAELLVKDGNKNLPFRLAPGEDEGPLRLGWGLIVPRRVVAVAGLGLSSRPPHLDYGGQLQLRVIFPLGVGVQVTGTGIWAGQVELPVVEGTTTAGLVYEVRPAFGFGLRMALEVGGRVHAYGGTTPGTEVDPVVAVQLGATYAITESLLLDLSVPLVGSLAHSHPLPDGRVWRRGELGFGLMLGLSWSYDLDWGS